MDTFKKGILTLLLIFTAAGALIAWEMNESPRKVFGFQYSYGRNGLVILGVLENSPAHQAGLSAGDRILRINGKTVSKEYNPIDQVEDIELTVEKQNGKRVTLNLHKAYTTEFSGPEGTRYAGPLLKMSGYREGDIVENLSPFRYSDGTKNSLYGFKSKIKLITFWATWCGACNSEIPLLKKLRKKYSEKDLTMIGVSMDSTKSTMTDFVSYKKMDWYHLWAGTDSTSKIHRLWEVHLIPTNIILNSSNEILEIVKNDTLLEEKISYYMSLN
ncbi:MAG: thioredoxin-like domain-containing protein [Leptospirales bacterium]